jgi:hypothetical protein
LSSDISLVTSLSGWSTDSEVRNNHLIHSDSACLSRAILDQILTYFESDLFSRLHGLVFMYDECSAILRTFITIISFNNLKSFGLYHNTLMVICVVSYYSFEAHFAKNHLRKRLNQRRNKEQQNICNKMNMLVLSRIILYDFT